MLLKMAERSRKVELVAYNPQWARLANEQASKLRCALGASLVQVEHIGSTAIPGIVAKPVLDLMPIVSDLKAADDNSEAVRLLGYEWHGEFGIPGRRFCTLSCPVSGTRLVHLHIFQLDSAHIDRHLAFRDYLRTHTDEARAYEAVKQRAASLHRESPQAYTEAKSGWIRSCEQRALAWRARSEP